MAEFAIVAPLLVLITLGAIDAGQTINVAQVVNDASREGARQATRADVQDAYEVESAVKAFIANSLPSESPETLNSAIVVTVSDSIGTLPDGDVSSVGSGSPVSVQVELQYDAVRWISFLPGFDGVTMSTTTMMRRD